MKVARDVFCFVANYDDPVRKKAAMGLIPKKMWNVEEVFSSAVMWSVRS